MSKVHFVLQGKGGVGKSVIASLIAQYLIEAGHNPLLVDTDPVNRSFASYKSLDVQELAIVEKGKINTRHFDKLAGALLDAETPAVVDNGAASFLPLSDYLHENDIAAILVDAGKELVIHTVLTGGASMADTMTGLSTLMMSFGSKAKIVVWLNPYFGDLVHAGKKITEASTYKTVKGKIAAEIEMPELNPDTFGFDFSRLLTEKLTFLQAADDAERNTFVRHRLARIKRDYFSQMEASGVF